MLICMLLFVFFLGVFAFWPELLELFPQLSSAPDWARLMWLVFAIWFHVIFVQAQVNELERKEARKQ
jgi:cytochrome c oxidase assembly factor CtaG